MDNSVKTVKVDQSLPVEKLMSAICERIGMSLLSQLLQSNKLIQLYFTLKVSPIQKSILWFANLMRLTALLP